MLKDHSQSSPNDQKDGRVSPNVNKRAIRVHSILDDDRIALLIIWGYKVYIKVIENYLEKKINIFPDFYRNLFFNNSIILINKATYPFSQLLAKLHDILKNFSIYSSKSHLLFPNHTTFIINLQTPLSSHLNVPFAPKIDSYPTPQNPASDDQFPKILLKI